MAKRLLAADPAEGVGHQARRARPARRSLKGLEAARRLQGRVLTYGMAFLLSGEKTYRDAAVAELDRALGELADIWWTPRTSRPFDLMTGELSMTYGIAYDWLYSALTPAERTRLREGVERRALSGYLEATTREKPPFWFTAHLNWNTVTNGGATAARPGPGRGQRPERASC